ncbi:MAG: L-seryl-tRNA(Sec) selenium transferase [Desulfobacteraceae bacterium 4572_88]|nr:MAG: L-seryl-tRNA(Sec) selenium transferase [Desulfobacteraceae bacterium 4572_88]
MRRDMNLDNHQQALLRMLPGVDRILELAKKEAFSENIPKKVQVKAARAVVRNLRNAILEGVQKVGEDSLSEAMILERVKKQTEAAMTPNLRRIINATGVVVHTNLGRSLLAADAIENLTLLASRYSNLEFDLSVGKRGSRYSCVESLLCEITGAEAGMVVNNNAGAVLLSLETLASGKKAIVSRGELVEIGGSFRIPDVMTKSGAILKEVGTTNRTHLRDYENAIDADTGLLLKVHTSNYSVVGFTASVSLKELAELGQTQQIPVMEDLGSGTFVDLSKYGMRKEPTVQESVATGADIVTFSGDKLLGGPQAGIIVGKADMISKIRQNPINRALRIDKLTLAALESTLRLYRDTDKAAEQIPTLRMLTCPIHEIERKAEQLRHLLTELDDPRAETKIMSLSSRVGGGALPLQELPSKCVGIRISGMSANAIERAMRGNAPPIIGRIEEDFFIMDLRTAERDELPIIQTAFGNLLNRGVS